MPAPPDTRPSKTIRAGRRSAAGRTLVFLSAFVLVSLALRLGFTFHYPQDYFGDAYRYMHAEQAARFIENGQWERAWPRLLRSDHTLFYWQCLGPAFAQRALARHRGVTPGDLPWVPSLFLILYSVAMVPLLYTIARRAGAPEKEALLAAFFAACSRTLFHYAPHYLPYDAAIFWALFALWIGWRPSRIGWPSLLSGVAAAISFLTYNGYWTLAAAVLFLHVLRNAKPLAVLGRGAAAAIGFAIPLGVVTLVYENRIGGSYWRAMADFSRTAVVGTFEEAWSLVWAYLWHAERGVLVAWLLAAAVAVLLIARRSMDKEDRVRGLRWLLALIGIYVTIGVFSAELHRLMIAGRHVRQLVPFFCLVAGFALAQARSKKRIGRGVTIAILALVLIQAAFNFGETLAQEFPLGVKRHVKQTFRGTFDEAMSTVTDRAGYGGKKRACSRYVLLNARWIYLPILGVRPDPPGEVAYRTRHPAQMRMNQYENYSPQERQILRNEDVSIRLIEKPESAWRAGCEWIGDAP